VKLVEFCMSTKNNNLKINKIIDFIGNYLKSQKAHLWTLEA
jgi:hypothetical protein